VENCDCNCSVGPILFLCRRGSKGRSSMANSRLAMIPDPSTYVAPENRVHPAPWKVRYTSPLSSGTRTSTSSLVSFPSVTLTPSNT
jgi:hypothetical protein